MRNCLFLNGTKEIPSSASIQRLLGYFLSLLLLGGCASYGVVENAAIPKMVVDEGYSLRAFDEAQRSENLEFMLTFSGGGTRAAAMAYGVMQELQATNIVIYDQQRRLLDEVDRISSVSGGSFTAAYYGLHGEELFENFEDDFLRLNMDQHLTEGLINPVHWFSTKGRTEAAVQYYQKALFHGATFADMMQPGRPLIIINASDLAYGVRFSFIQEYFNLLCSDLASFPVARAVAASSAVPVIFNPVVLENHAGCGDNKTSWPLNAEQRSEHDAEFAILYEGLKTFGDKDQRKFIHLVDGGITDNMGLRAYYDLFEMSGGLDTYLQSVDRRRPRRIVLISVNASTKPVTEMEQSARQPSIKESISSMSDVQLHRYNASTVKLIEENLTAWAQQLSTPEAPVTPYFIRVNFDEVTPPKRLLFLNKIPTSFSLSDEQVDKLIASARNLLRENPVFQQLLSDLDKP